MDRELTREQRMQRLGQALMALPALTRAVFLAVRQDGLDYIEVAERFGLSVRQVERHVARALTGLRLGLENDGRRSWWRRLFGR